MGNRASLPNQNNKSEAFSPAHLESGSLVGSNRTRHQAERPLMRCREPRVGLINFGVWRFEIFDDLKVGWKLVLHPPIGCAIKPETMTT